MILIIGGAYQGKLDYARSLGVKEEDVFYCSKSDIDFSKPCIYRIEQFCITCEDPLLYFKENKSLWQSSILICEDIFCGVVPLDPELRLWRHKTAQLCKYLADESDSAVRMFCGIAQKLK